MIRRTRPLALAVLAASFATGLALAGCADSQPTRFYTLSRPDRRTRRHAAGELGQTFCGAGSVTSS